jgi:hypothetical protein
MALTVVKGAAFVVAGFAALLGGGLACIASIVGVCAAVCVLLYGTGYLLAYSSASGSCGDSWSPAGFLLVAPVVGALAHERVDDSSPRCGEGFADVRALAFAEGELNGGEARRLSPLAKALDEAWLKAPDLTQG